MFERSVEDVRQDLHVAVAVGAEPGSGLHAVVVQDPEAAERHVVRVVVVPERERVPAVEPFPVGVSTLPGPPDLNHRGDLARLTRSIP